MRWNTRHNTCCEFLWLRMHNILLAILWFSAHRLFAERLHHFPFWIDGWIDCNPKVVSSTSQSFTWRWMRAATRFDSAPAKIETIHRKHTTRTETRNRYIELTKKKIISVFRSTCNGRAHVLKSLSNHFHVWLRVFFDIQPNRIELEKCYFFLLKNITTTEHVRCSRLIPYRTKQVAWSHEKLTLNKNTNICMEHGKCLVPMKRRTQASRHTLTSHRTHFSL